MRIDPRHDGKVAQLNAGTPIIQVGHNGREDAADVAFQHDGLRQIDHCAFNLSIQIACPCHDSRQPGKGFGDSRLDWAAICNGESRTNHIAIGKTPKRCRRVGISCSNARMPGHHTIGVGGIGSAIASPSDHREMIPVSAPGEEGGNPAARHADDKNRVPRAELVSVITTQPGSKSQENAHRRGFALLYSRAILVREPRRPGA